jgi:hypothetical protein
MKARGTLKIRSDGRARFTELFVPWSVLLVVLVLTIAPFAYLNSIKYNLGRTIACSSDGITQAPMDSSTRAHWVKPSYVPGTFFFITLVVLNLSFTAAKAIDVGWNLVVGRGGRALLLILTWPALRNSITRYGASLSRLCHIQDNGL